MTDSKTNTETRTVLPPAKARQGRLGRPVLVVLAAGLGLAFLALAVLLSMSTGQNVPPDVGGIVEETTPPGTTPTQ